MQMHKIAIVGTDPSTVIAVLDVWGKDKRDALARVRKDEDMSGVRCYPLDEGRVSEHHV
jgi:hypothetical protein